MDRPWTAIALTGDLQALFPDREVDLALLDRADPLFLKQVLEHGRLLAGSPRRPAEMILDGDRS